MTSGPERQRGQSLVELALLLPVLLLILLGVFDLGRVWRACVVISNAAREGAYYGSMHPSETNTIKQRAVAEAQDSGILVTAADVAVLGGGAVGTPIRVTVSYNFALLSTALFGAGTLGLQGHAEMMVVR